MPATENNNITKALTVYNLSLDGKKTIDEACVEVGITPSQYRRWLSRGQQAFDLLRQAIEIKSRERIMEIVSIEDKLYDAIRERVFSDLPLSVSDQIAYLRFLSSERAKHSQILSLHGSGPNNGDIDYLLQPDLVPAVSKLRQTTTEVELVIRDRQAPQSVIDIESSDS